MRPLGVVMGGVYGKYPAQMPLTEDQHPVGDLGPDRQHQAFGEAVRPRTPRRDLDHLDTRVRTEVTDQMLIFGERHLRGVLAVCGALQRAATAPSAAATSPAPNIARPRIGARQDPTSTDPRRPAQRVRGGSLKPLVTHRGRVLAPDRAAARKGLVRSPVAKPSAAVRPSSTRSTHFPLSRSL